MSYKFSHQGSKKKGCHHYGYYNNNNHYDKHNHEHNHYHHKHNHYDYEINGLSTMFTGSDMILFSLKYH